MKKKFLLLFLVLSLTAVFPATSPAQSFYFLENSIEGKEAPYFKLKNTKGDVSDLPALRGKDRAIVFFWATWCPYCRQQLSELNKRLNQIEKQGIKLVLVDLEEPAAKVAAYLAKNKISIDAYLDTDSAVADDYGVNGLPTMVFIDKEGIVKAVENVLPEKYQEIF